MLIIGAARQGLALARYLAGKGARVTLNDGQNESELRSSVDSLKDLSINWVLGHHPISLLEGIDIVCPSGGVPLNIPLLAEAKNRGIPFSNDSQIFLSEVKAKTIGITGSAGKTTTTTLLGEIARKAHNPAYQVWVGGNIGNPLINEVKKIKSDDLVILELSSFQLELMTRSPHIALITNITPNHLDRHGTLEAYTAAKANILNYQSGIDFAILNRDDAGSIALKSIIKGRLVTFGFEPFDKAEDGVFVDGEGICLQQQGKIRELCRTKDIPLIGKHNLSNTLAAAAASMVLGFDDEIVSDAINNFKGVPHRLQWIGEWHGIQWIDDSIATAPERSLAAINAFEQPIVLLLGGKDKNLPWEKLISRVNEKVDHLIIFGEAAEKINATIESMNFEARFTLDICHHLEQAVSIAHQRAKRGDVVLLSPGGTSYDQFKDFEERGEKFKSWVQQLQ